ncbi:helix-turn-helix domain-containing protein [Lacticaseibacillus absianus]|uniref:helix-turn-helix domain-containing protein n=1 Tax=Lacticaseibacillus absianus TaxID=2729623 RepID=UPI0015CD977F|nr:helix-turn-helix domain-containing protein [Lacticaseibacillus absianus]
MFSQLLVVYREYVFNQDSDRLLTINEAARLLNISRQSFEDWMLDPSLPRIVVGRSGTQLRIPKRGLLEYVRIRSERWFENR